MYPTYTYCIQKLTFDALAGPRPLGSIMLPWLIQCSEVSHPHGPPERPNSCYRARMTYDQLTDAQRAKLQEAATLVSARLGRAVKAQDLLEAAERAAAATIEAVTGSQRRGAGMTHCIQRRAFDSLAGPRRRNAQRLP
jgi:hypothetical protein